MLLQGFNRALLYISGIDKTHTDTHTHTHTNSKTDMMLAAIIGNCVSTYNDPVREIVDICGNMSD